MSVATGLALSLALGALAYAAYLHRRGRRLAEEVSRLRDSYERFRRHTETEVARVAEAAARARYEALKQAGRLRFHEKMTFREALAINPNVEQAMVTLHVGGCPDCAVDLDETLAYGAAKNGMDVEAFLIALNNLPESEYEQATRALTQTSELKVVR